MSIFRCCWGCGAENEAVTYSLTDGQYCPKCRDRFYNNYELVCPVCDKRYIQITKRAGIKWFNRHCKICDEILRKEFMESYEW